MLITKFFKTLFLKHKAALLVVVILYGAVVFPACKVYAQKDWWEVVKGGGVETIGIDAFG